MENDKTESLFQKGVKLIHKKIDSELEKAKGIVSTEGERVTIDFDPWYHGDDGGYKRKPSKVSYALLDTLSKKDSVISAIIQIRINQVAAFSEYQPTKYDVGWVLEKKDMEDSEEMSEQDKAELSELKEFVLNCGYKDLIPVPERIKFDEFLRREVKDRLVFDQTAVEKVRSRDGSICYFAPVDGSTIRFATTNNELNPNVRINHDEDKQTEQRNTFNLENYDPKKETKDKNEDYAYVQVVDEVIQRALTYKDLIFRMANVSNGVKNRGYGCGELEMLITLITNHLNAETYNSKLFTQGHVQKGILHFKANISQRKLNMFKKAWYAQSSGVINAWRTPIVAGMEEVKWVPLNDSNKDIEFHLWMEYNIKLICAIYLIDPSEINFDISQGVSSGGSSLFGTKNEYKLKQSKDRGLRPLLRFFEDIINEILEEVNPRWVFKFVGMEAEDKKAEVERNKLEIETYKSVNEVRKENNLEPIALNFKIGDKTISPFDIPANPSLIQLINTCLQQSAQASMMGGMSGGFPNQNGNSSVPGNPSKPNEVDSYNPEEDFGKAKQVKIEYFKLT